MSIKTFEEYQVDNQQIFEVKTAFDIAVQMCKEHYEEEKVAIHEYYNKHIEGLLAKYDEENKVPKPKKPKVKKPSITSEKDGGKLT